MLNRINWKNWKGECVTDGCGWYERDLEDLRDRLIGRDQFQDVVYGTTKMEFHLCEAQDIAIALWKEIDVSADIIFEKAIDEFYDNVEFIDLFPFNEWCSVDVLQTHIDIFKKSNPGLQRFETEEELLKGVIGLQELKDGILKVEKDNPQHLLFMEDDQQIIELDKEFWEED